MVEKNKLKTTLDFIIKWFIKLSEFSYKYSFVLGLLVMYFSFIFGLFLCIVLLMGYYINDKN